MIGRIAGLLVSSEPPRLLVDCGGVGYDIEAPLPVFFELPAIGQQVVLHTHMVVREDAQLLYGFTTLAQRAMFRELIKVSNVGAKMAIAILSGLSADEFSECVANQDVSTLTRLPGVGKKTAERLIVEMQDRVAKLATTESGTMNLPLPPSSGGNTAQAVAALEALGYKNAEARRMVKGQQGETVEEIVRDALRAVTR